MNKAFIGAKRKGAEARASGKPRISPYPDKRGGEHGQIITYSRTFDKMWKEGWDEEDQRRCESCALVVAETGGASGLCLAHQR